MAFIEGHTVCHTPVKIGQPFLCMSAHGSLVVLQGVGRGLLTGYVLALQNTATTTAGIDPVTEGHRAKYSTP